MVLVRASRVLNGVGWIFSLQRLAAVTSFNFSFLMFISSVTVSKHINVQLK